MTGNPIPVVKWLKDGEVTDPDIPVSRENAGLYIIEADGASLFRKSIQVLVLCGYSVS